MLAALVVAVVALAVVATWLWHSRLRLARDRYIRDFALPRGLLDRLAGRRPAFSLKERVLVSRALRQFFLAYLNGGCRFVSMPSQAADDLWHEFILYTREYEQFCRQAFGRFLHHTPAVVLGQDRLNNEGLRRVWWQACKEENINPRRPTRLPLLFALDAKLGIGDGFAYSLDCRRINPRDSGSPHCAGDFGDRSIDGSLDGFCDSGGSHGDGAGTAGDAGGSGDSGGCGGGCGGGD